MKRAPDPVPNPDERPKGYRDREVLENLYVTRGWRRKDIADHFDVAESRVDHWLSELDVSRNVAKSRAPSGDNLATELYEIGLEDARL